jgi:hypothetical protein
MVGSPRQMGSAGTAVYEIGASTTAILWIDSVII